MLPWILLLGITTGLNGGGCPRYPERWVQRGSRWRASRWGGFKVAMRGYHPGYAYRVMKRGYG